MRRRGGSFGRAGHRARSGRGRYEPTASLATPQIFYEEGARARDSARYHRRGSKRPGGGKPGAVYGAPTSARAPRSTSPTSRASVRSPRRSWTTASPPAAARCVRAQRPATEDLRGAWRTSSACQGRAHPRTVLAWGHGEVARADGRRVPRRPRPLFPRVPSPGERARRKFPRPPLPLRARGTSSCAVRSRRFSEAIREAGGYHVRPPAKRPDRQGARGHDQGAH